MFEDKDNNSTTSLLSHLATSLDLIKSVRANVSPNHNPSLWHPEYMSFNYSELCMVILTFSKVY